MSEAAACCRLGGIPAGALHWGEACRLRRGQMEASAAPWGPVPGVCLRACTVGLVRMVEVANFQLEARTNTDDDDDWTMPWQDSGVSRWAGEGGRGHSSSEADPVTSGGEAQVLRQQPAIDGIPRVEASRKLRRAELRDGMLKTPKSAASGSPI